jgi:hypothetical protein
MIFRTLLLVALFALLAAPAWAACPTSGDAACFTNCRGAATTNTNIDNSKSRVCYVFDSTASAATDDSELFSVKSRSALICLNPDTASAGADVTQIKVRKCHGGTKPTSNPENECIDLNGSAMDGTEGAAVTQNACLRVAAGSYYIDITTAPAAADNAVVSVQGED